MNIFQQLGDRIVGHIHHAGTGPGSDQRCLDRIMADVEVTLQLARREGWDALRIAEALSPSVVHGSIRYPLPKRTRQVLREERCGAGGPLYRWNPDWGTGCFEVRHSDGVWLEREIRGHELGLMIHALDLHSNPYRTEQYEPDESNPWPEETP